MDRIIRDIKLIGIEKNKAIVMINKRDLYLVGKKEFVKLDKIAGCFDNKNIDKCNPIW